MELQSAKNPNLARTINNIIKCCYKGVDLKGTCYTKLKELNPELMKNIFGMSSFYTGENYLHLISFLIFYSIEYVKYIFAPRLITQKQFSDGISLRSRHLVDQAKGKNKENSSASSTSSTKKQQPKPSKNKKTTEDEQRSPSPKVLMENFDNCE